MDISSNGIQQPSTASLFLNQSHAKIQAEDSQPKQQSSHVSILEVQGKCRSVSPSPMPFTNEGTAHKRQIFKNKNNSAQGIRLLSVIKKASKHTPNNNKRKINLNDISHEDNKRTPSPVASHLKDTFQDYIKKSHLIPPPENDPDDEPSNRQTRMERLLKMPENEIELLDLKLLRKMMKDAGMQRIILKTITVYLQHDQVRIYGASSIFVFKGDNPIRILCSWIINWRYFEWFILIIISVNSVTMAIYDYSDRNSLTEYNQILDVISLISTVIFSIEAVLSIIAKGLVINRNAYLRTGWGVLDFIVVISGLIELFMTSVKLKSFRVLRALRPLKSITVIPSMRKLVTALIFTLRDFGHVGIFLMYVFILFAIMGVHLYSGITYNQCRIMPQPLNSTYWPIDQSVKRLCTLQATGRFQCPSQETCGNPQDYEGFEFNKMVYINNPQIQYGIHNFDNLFNSLQVIFQLVTTDLWTSYMYNMMDADTPFLGAVFIILIVVVGSFFLMNLILTVIIQSFVDITKQDLAEEAQRLNQLHATVLATNKQLTISMGKGEKNASDNVPDDQFKTGKSSGSGRQQQQQRTKSLFSKGKTPRELQQQPEDQSGDEEMTAQKQQPPQSAQRISEEKDDSVEERGNANEMTFLKDRVRQKKVVSIFAKSISRKDETRMEEVTIKQNEEEQKEEKLQKYLAKKLQEDQRKLQLFGQLLDQQEHRRSGGDTSKHSKLTPPSMRSLSSAKGSSLGGGGSGMSKVDTIRDVTNMRMRMHLQRKHGNLSRHYMMFQIEQRAESNKIYGFFYGLVDSTWFAILVSIAIIANTVFLSLDRYPDRYNLEILINKVNIGFSVFFMIEVIVKLLGLGIKGYLYDMYNIFDCLIVLGSIVDLAISLILSQDTNSVITVFRSFRLLRLFKLAKSWKRLDYLLKTMRSAIKDVANFSILMTVFLFTFAIFGMELFAHRTKFDSNDNVDMTSTGQSPMNNFDNLMFAFTTVFVVLTGDWWSTIYFAHYRANQSPITTVYFILIIIIGQKVLLNLFLTILLQNFDESNLKQFIQNELKNNLSNSNSIKQTEQIKGFFRRMWSAVIKKIGFQSEEQQLQIQENGTQIVINNKAEDTEGSPHKKHISLLQGTSLYLFSSTNTFRLRLQKLTTNRYFEYFILIVIVLSSVQLALDKPLLDPHSTYKIWLTIIDQVTTLIFLMEALLKITALGFLFNGPQSYLRQSWNLVDFVILLLSLLTLLPWVGTLQIMKMFRIFRILRLVSREERLKIVIKAVLQASPSIMNVLIVLIFFMLIFGILCVSYFKGKFFNCKSSPLSGLAVANKWDCLGAGGEWVNSDGNFDNLLEAIWMLFIMATGTWSDYMYLLASSTEIDDAPARFNQPFWLFFCFFYVVIAQFFLMNLFVGVVVSTFTTEADLQSGNNLLTDKQKEWIDARVLVLKASPLKKPQPPNNIIRRVIFNIERNKYFNRFILGCIILNTMVLALKWYMQPDWVDRFTELLNYIFVAIFTAEALIKMIALNPLGYLKSSSWNRYDFFILLGSYLGIVLQFFSTLTIKGALTIIRAFRILRIVRLIKSARSLNIIFTTFTVSLPALLNVSGLLLLILYVYSIIGMQLFGDVMRNGKFNDSMNFENFTNAFLTLCAVATSDSWNLITYSALQKHSPHYQCVNDPSFEQFMQNGGQLPIGCGSGRWGALFFISLNLLVCQIFLKIFVAIILQAFLDTQVKDVRLFNEDMLLHFQQVWSEFDPDATGYMPIRLFRQFLLDLGQPLGFEKQVEEDIQQQDKFIAGLKLPTYDRMTHFNFLDVLNALSLRLMVIDHSMQLKVKRANIVKKKILKQQQSNLISPGDKILQSNEGDGSATPANNPSSSQHQYLNTEQEQEDLKQKIEKEIYKLLLKNESDGILTFKELQQQQQRQQLNNNSQGNRRDTEFTSEHVAAARWAIEQMKRFIKIRRQEKRREMTSKSKMEMSTPIKEEEIVEDVDEEVKIPEASGFQQQPLEDNSYYNNQSFINQSNHFLIEEVSAADHMISSINQDDAKQVFRPHTFGCELEHEQAEEEGKQHENEEQRSSFLLQDESSENLVRESSASFNESHMKNQFYHNDNQDECSSYAPTVITQMNAPPRKVFANLLDVRQGVKTQNLQ